MALAGIELRYLVDQISDRFKITISVIFMASTRTVFSSNFTIPKKVICL